MAPLLQLTKTRDLTIHRYSTVIELADGATTTVHAVRYEREAVKPRIVAFEHATYLVDWCREHGVTEGVTGGFFLRKTDQLLGDTWVNHTQLPSVPVAGPWRKVRGSVYVSGSDRLAVGPRNIFPAHPANLLQAGPVLLRHGKPQVINGREHEGMSADRQQFDTDITIGRYPRSAIGVNTKHIWAVVCDGRSEFDAGLTLEELADVMRTLGATDALNLDGGASASLVSGGKMLNHSRGDDHEFPKGRPIYTAIVFESVEQTK